MEARAKFDNGSGKDVLVLTGLELWRCATLMQPGAWSSVSTRCVSATCCINVENMVGNRHNWFASVVTILCCVQAVSRQCRKIHKPLLVVLLAEL